MSLVNTAAQSLAGSLLVLRVYGLDDEDLKAGAVGPVGRTDKAGAFDERDLAARAVGPVGRTYSSR